MRWVHSPDRKAALMGGLVLGAVTVLLAMRTPSGVGSEPQTGGIQSSESSPMVRVKVFNAEGKLVGPLEMPKVVKTDAEWKKLLTAEQYRVARSKGTETPFCGTLLDNKTNGVYACVCCGLPLFTSDSKFHSGTGWPSFFEPIAPENVIEHSDHSLGMIRAEIECARCDAHLGHVFDDGPNPSGLRYCVNSESLSFTAMEDVKKLADPAAAKADSNVPAVKAVAVFAGGCFWCTEAVFKEIKGVLEVVPGYAGGQKSTANYEAVCEGDTGHAESIRITYDPSRVTYEKLLEVFFATHDPTQLNRQGPDAGTQYRSAVFYADETQKRAAEAYIADLTTRKVFARPIATTLEPLKEFFLAEEYHQNYAQRHPENPYIRQQTAPKLQKLHKQFAQDLKP
jgi:peptide methionine sulfoxide reductase msrA/msrB